MAVSSKLLAVGAACLGGAFAFTSVPAQAWQPTRPVEFIVPAGTGGGADQMARVIQGIITKHNLMPQSMVVINKAGGAGGEGFLDVKNATRQSAQADHHAVQPVHDAAGDRHSVQLEGSHAGRHDGARRVRAVGQCRDAVQDREGLRRRRSRRRRAGQFKMGGTGSKQEDQIITVALEKTTGKKMTYIPYKGGGEVAVQLVGKHVNSTVNNPIEAVAQWRAGKLRPLCVFDAKTLPYTDKIAGDMAWSDIPTCKSQGLDVEYLMLRGIFMAPGVTKEQVAYYVDLFKKVRETPEWKQLMHDGAFNQTFMTGADYAKWVAEAEKRHRS